MRVVVAGVAGGSGATTVAALLAHTLGPRLDGAVRLLDHGGGSLAARTGMLPPGGRGPIDLIDLGPVNTPERWEVFADDEAAPVLTVSMTPLGMAAAHDAVAMLTAHAPAAIARLVLVAVGAGAGDAAWLALGRGEAAAAARCVLPRDRRLAQGGAVSPGTLSPGARRGADAIAAAVASRLQR